MPEHSLSRVLKNAVVLVGGIGVRLVLSFVFVVIVARYLGVEGFGKYSVSQNLFELFTGLSAGGLALLVTREIAKKRAQASQILTAATVLLSIMSLVAAGAMLLFSRFAGYEADTQTALLIVSLALIPAAAGALCEAVFIAYERAEFVAFGTILESGLRIGLGTAALAAGYGFFSLAWTLVVARVCTTLVYFFLLRRLDANLQWSFRSEQLRELVRHGKVFTLEYWFSTIYTNFPIVVLGVAHGETAVGVFTAAQKLLRLVAAATVSFRTAMFPHMARLFERSRDDFRELCVQSLRTMLLLVLPAVLTVSLLADRVVELLFSQQYVESILVLRVLIWTSLFDFWNPFLSHAMVARGQQTVTLRIAIIKLAFGFTVPLWLIVSYGALGTASATVINAAFAFCMYAGWSVGAKEATRMFKGTLPTLAAIAVLAGIVWWFRAAPLPFVIVLSGALCSSPLIAFRDALQTRVQQLKARNKAPAVSEPQAEIHRTTDDDLLADWEMSEIISLSDGMFFFPPSQPEKTLAVACAGTEGFR